MNASAPQLQVAFVECNPHSLEHYVREIAREFDVTVVPLLLGDLVDPTRRAELAGVDCMVSTFFHLSEVRRILRSVGLGTELPAEPFENLLPITVFKNRLPRRKDCSRSRLD